MTAQGARPRPTAVDRDELDDLGMVRIPSRISNLQRGVLRKKNTESGRIS